ncbi:MAG TPA: hypothetical protein VGQ06_10430 [Gemmatimonadales bacterium]|nr:hypothetical protein [Gemmatimonadales bacterium]
MRAAALLVAAGCCAAGVAHAQTPDSARAAQDSALRVFLDCPDTFCDFDYYRTEITFVNWVRERQDAQIHVLITTQPTGGGREYTLTFLGLRRFAGVEDTLRHLSHSSDTDDDIRKSLARTMRLGLVRFAAKTPVAQRLEISYSAPAGTAAQVRDVWNYWVFNVRVSSNFYGEHSYKNTYTFGGLSASRITEVWKLTLSTNQSYQQNDFLVPVYDSTGAQIGEKLSRNITRSYGADILVARSAGRHWSTGLRASAFSSTYSNQDLRLRGGPAVEFDVFPYSQSTRKLLTLEYALNVVAFNYRDTTIFNRLRETRFTQSLTLSLDVKQPWGSAGASVQGSHYLHDFGKNHLTFFGNGSFRVYKGLSLDFFGIVELIHDQLSIEKGGASEQEVLLRRRQLATSYQYQGFVGLRYTFGSKFANIVNPRFGGGGGFFFSN